MTGPVGPGRPDRPGRRALDQRPVRTPRGQAYYASERARRVPLGCLVTAIIACALALLVLVALAFVDFDRTDSPTPEPSPDPAEAAPEEGRPLPSTD